MEKKIWYHCTVDDHGDVFEAKRITPKDIAKSEPKTPRLCVSDTVAGCFTAVIFAKYGFVPVHVYRTETERGSVAPVGVWDKLLTGERWLIPPVRLRRERIIPPEIVDKVQWSSKLFHMHTRAKPTLKIRGALLIKAIEVLGVPHERRMARIARKFWKIDDPDEFLLNEALKIGRHRGGPIHCSS